MLCNIQLSDLVIQVIDGALQFRDLGIDLGNIRNIFCFFVPPFG